MISNSSPLIILAKLDLLKELKKLYPSIQITKTIFEECIEEGLAKEKKDAFLLNALYQGGVIKVIDLNKKQSELAERIAKDYHLDQGESEVLAFAVSIRAKTILMDEALGRSAALLLGIKPSGTLRVLLDYYKRNLISEQILKNKVEELIGVNFRLDAEVLARFWKLFEMMKKRL